MIQSTTIKHFDSIDILRVLACCMVLTTHSNECYYISNFYDGGSVDTINVSAWQGEAIWAGILGTLCRASVPLFVMISGFLLLPMKQGMTMRQFYVKRATRVLVPLAVWTVVYAVYTTVKFDEGFTCSDDYIRSFMSAIGWFFVNFPPQIGHLWYVYMLIGLYLFIPVLSPWVERATKHEIQTFLGIWMFTMIVPWIHLLWPEILGECYWNPNSMVYYFSGFIGYLIAGAYARKFLLNSDNSYTCTGLFLVIIGYASTLGGFVYQLYHLVPTVENYDNYFSQFEFTWTFNNITVGIMTLGIFLLLFKRRPKHIPAIIKDFSRLSYGIYLAHIMLLTAFYEEIFKDCIWPTPCKILSIACLTIISTYILIKVLSYLPKSKWIVG